MREKIGLNNKASVGIIIIALFGLLSTQAIAASFDCKKAATWVEKTVCSNPELSKLDEELAKSYHDALASLSPEGQKETKQYQKQWLKNISHIKGKRSSFAEEISPIAGVESSVKKDISPMRLKSAFEKRITQLQQILIKFPDRIFRHVYVSHSKVEKTCPNLFVDQDLTYPQIENPRDENEKFWNNFISKQAIDHFGPSDECQDINDDYDVGFSNKHMISIKRSHYWFTQEAPAQHGYLAPDSISWLLESKRELKTADLFDDKTDWPNKIAALVAQKVEGRDFSDAELMNMVTSPHSWELSKDGLGLLSFFNAAGYGNNPIIILDWKTLAPYLGKNGRSLIFD